RYDDNRVHALPLKSASRRSPSTALKTDLLYRAARALALHPFDYTEFAKGDANAPSRPVHARKGAPPVERPPAPPIRPSGHRGRKRPGEARSGEVRLRRLRRLLHHTEALERRKQRQTQHVHDQRLADTGG